MAYRYWTRALRSALQAPKRTAIPARAMAAFQRAAICIGRSYSMKQTRLLLPQDQLRARFEAARINYDRSVILTCGSRFTACMLALGLHLTGMNDWKVYDGSWDEWGRRADLPIETGSQ